MSTHEKISDQSPRGEMVGMVIGTHGGMRIENTFQRKPRRLRKGCKNWLTISSARAVRFIGIVLKPAQASKNIQREQASDSELPTSGVGGVL